MYDYVNFMFDHPPPQTKKFFFFLGGGNGLLFYIIKPGEGKNTISKVTETYFFWIFFVTNEVTKSIFTPSPY